MLLLETTRKGSLEEDNLLFSATPPCGREGAIRGRTSGDGSAFWNLNAMLRQDSWMAKDPSSPLWDERAFHSKFGDSCLWYEDVMEAAYSPLAMEKGGDILCETCELTWPQVRLITEPVLPPPLPEACSEFWTFHCKLIKGFELINQCPIGFLVMNSSSMCRRT